MKRIYHPWNLWEDYRFNFYGSASSFKTEENLTMCRDLFADLPMFELALETIINEWPYSCEHNLTNDSLNQIAYMGQASCALLFKAPCQAGSAGYNLLNDDQKKAADAMAQKYIDIWLSRHQSKISA